MGNIVPVYSVSYMFLIIPVLGKPYSSLFRQKLPEESVKLFRESYMAYWILFPFQTPFSSTK